jgi:hypothetical protein
MEQESERPAAPLADAHPAPVAMGTLPVNVVGAGSGTFKTVVLSVNNPYKIALPEDNTRRKATIIALDNPVVLCHAEEQAQDPTNLVASVPQPNGGYIPINVPVPVSSHSVVFVAATTTATNSRVFVSIERDGDA